jgi:hypothetical protein
MCFTLTHALIAVHGLRAVTAAFMWRWRMLPEHRHSSFKWSTPRSDDWLWRKVNHRAHALPSSANGCPPYAWPHGWCRSLFSLRPLTTPLLCHHAGGKGTAERTGARRQFAGDREFERLGCFAEYFVTVKEVSDERISSSSSFLLNSYLFVLLNRYTLGKRLPRIGCTIV